MKKTIPLAIAAALAMLLAGCGILFPSQQMRATKNTPGFKAGFSDGCSAASAASANMREDKFRDQASYDTDPNYRAGWANGMANCRTVNAPASPNAGPVPDNLPGSKRTN
jgi:hypothetical protein